MTITVIVKRHQLEPGAHICRKQIAVLESIEVDLPRDEAAELRPDWGVWVEPVVTFTAIERALRKRGFLMIDLPSDQSCRAASNFHQTGENERLMNEAIAALLPHQPGDPFPEWVRVILKSNDGDWARRMDTQRVQAENAVAGLDGEARLLRDEITQLKADKQWLIDKGPRPYHRDPEDSDADARYGSQRSQLTSLGVTIQNLRGTIETLKANEAGQGAAIGSLKWTLKNEKQMVDDLERERDHLRERIRVLEAQVARAIRLLTPAV